MTPINDTTGETLVPRASGRMLLAGGALKPETDTGACLVTTTCHNIQDAAEITATLELDGRRVRLSLERRQDEVAWEVRAV
jgi:hypothetical protein